MVCVSSFVPPSGGPKSSRVACARRLLFELDVASFVEGSDSDRL